MSTYTLITILAYITLNIPNTQSKSIPFAITCDIEQPDFAAFKGGIATFGEAGDTLVEKLAEQVDATAASKITFGESTVATSASRGVIIQTLFESESLSSLETITQGLEATIGNYIPAIIAPSGGQNLPAGTYTIVDAVTLTTDVPISTSFATSFNWGSRSFDSFKGDATPNVAATDMVQALAMAQAPVAASGVNFEVSTARENALNGITVETILSSESVSDLEAVTQALEASIGVKLPAIASTGGGTSIDANEVSVSDLEAVTQALETSIGVKLPAIASPGGGTPLPAPIPQFEKPIAITIFEEFGLEIFEDLGGISTLSITGTTIVEAVAVHADTVLAAMIEFGPSTAAIHIRDGSDNQPPILIQTTMISDSATVLDQMVTPITNNIGQLLPAIIAPVGSSGTDAMAGSSVLDVATAPTKATLTFSPTSTPTGLTTDPTRPPTGLTTDPTRPPTRLPTRPPTRFPTPPPTHLPTRPPTHLPTRPPTHLPTRPPTRLPTLSPTRLTPNPTPSPTDDDFDDSDDSNDDSEDNVAALYGENKQLNEANNATNDGPTTNTIIVRFSNGSLMNIWILFSAFMIVNIICCYLYSKKRMCCKSSW